MHRLTPMALALSLSFAASACSGDDDGKTSPPTPTPKPTPTPMPQPTSGALSVTLTQAPSDMLQAAAVEVTTTADATLHLEWTDGDGHTASHAPAEPGSQVVPVLGMKADRTYTLTVTATTADGAVSDEELTFQTAAVPSWFPVGEVVVERDEPTLTLMSLLTGNNGVPDPANAVAVFDENGEYVYWQGVLGRMHDARPADRGLELFVGDDYPEIRDVDMLGNLLVGYRTADSPYPASGPEVLDVASPGRFHHDHLSVGDGTRWVLSKQVISVPEYPLDYTLAASAPADIADGVLHHFAADGSTLKTISLADVLPTSRVAFDSIEPTGVEGAPDWTHENAVNLHPDGDLLVSMRHQDAILKLDPDTEEIAWILGNHENWPAEYERYLLEPIGDVEWPYHQHAVSVRADGSIMMFDNGNFRASPGPGVQPPDESEFYSRVVAYEVDPDQMTVEEVLDRRLQPRAFAIGVGDADELPNGNVVGHFGYIVREGGVPNEDLGRGRATVRVVEWDAAGDELWHLFVATDQLVPQGWSSFRSERIDSLYP